jgi:hypothetical protein
MTAPALQDIARRANVAQLGHQAEIIIDQLCHLVEGLNYKIRFIYTSPVAEGEGGAAGGASHRPGVFSSHKKLHCLVGQKWRQVLLLGFIARQTRRM